ncbi:hypothetical protein [Acetonema longum]|uniref:Uncharacterized protein n=1 Tax=Acetonema longum DSM 6540 TaxID=1009370 RepID=F7NN04_9FIRM|nr:hypothetical protein [Acetonema longum]EGO62582.1 hypothetical protein ALO_17436 [Acetonema longum DSM 6540]
METAEQLFADTVRTGNLWRSDNKKPRCWVERRDEVTTDEVIHRLEKSGLKKISSRTLRNYANNGLCPRADVRGRGRGNGAGSEWPEETPSHFYASYNMLHGRINSTWKLGIEEIAKIKDDALMAVNTDDYQNLGLKSEAWLSLVSDFYNGSIETPETRLLARIEREKIEPWINALGNMAPEAKEAFHQIVTMEPAKRDELFKVVAKDLARINRLV